MSKGGSNGPQQVEQNTSNLPSYAEPYFKDMMARTGYESSLPYTPYGGQRLADFNPVETVAQNRFIQSGISDTPESMTQAIDYAGKSGQLNPFTIPMFSTGLGSLQETEGLRDRMVNPYQAGQIEAGSVIDPGVIESYMSPYMQNVTDIRKREAKRRSDQEGASMGLGAAGQGSLGGYREAIMQAERERNLLQQMDDIQDTGSQDAFSAAAGLYEGDRGARFNAFNLNEGARQAGAGLDLQSAGQAAELEDLRTRMAGGIYSNFLGGQQQQLGAAGMLGDLTGMNQQQEFDRWNAMQGVGSQRRDLQQTSLDMGYQDFLRQQAYPREQLNFYQSSLFGLPNQPGGTTSVYGQNPSDWQQALGSGIAGVGLYNAYGQQS
jgi:hypothetical protein